MPCGLGQHVDVRRGDVKQSKPRFTLAGVLMDGGGCMSAGVKGGRMHRSGADHESSGSVRVVSDRDERHWSGLDSLTCHHGRRGVNAAVQPEPECCCDCGERICARGYWMIKYPDLKVRLIPQSFG